MNWGHKIAIVIILFIMGMLGMVYYATIQTNEMIDENYYEKELAYQSIIDAKQNLMDITSNNMVSQNINEVIIIFPKGAFEHFEKGTIELLRNDAKRKDIILEVEPTGYDRRTISKTLLSKGMYRARIAWRNNNSDFYREETLFVE